MALEESGATVIGRACFQRFLGALGNWAALCLCTQLACRGSSREHHEASISQPAGPEAAATAGAAGDVANEASADGFDGRVDEWRGRPGGFRLVPHGAGARGGTVWAARVGSALMIAGVVDGPPPSFARSTTEMRQGDHVEVWIASVEKPELPKIEVHGRWNAGDLHLEPASACTSQLAHACADDELSSSKAFVCQPGAARRCQAWVAAQRARRRTLERLFVRQWQLAPDLVTVETYAKPASQMIRRPYENDPYASDPLSITGWPRFLVQSAPAGSGEAYSFEVLIPWDAFPPLEALKLSKVRVLVDVFSPGDPKRYGSFASTAPNRVYGKVDSFPIVDLEPAVRFELGPCRYPLEKGAYFKPTASQLVERDIFFTPVGFDLRGFDFADYEKSFAIEERRYFSLQLGDGETACGPSLRIRKGDEIKLLNATIRPDTQVRKLNDRIRLLQTGPFADPESEGGSGQCGACPRMIFSMLALDDRIAQAKKAFEHRWIEPVRIEPGTRILVSDDWRRIDVYERMEDTEGGGPITKTSNCLDERQVSYHLCGRKQVSAFP